MTVTVRMRVYLQGEATRIGSGWRIVEAVIARKWVWLKAGGRRTKITKEVWDSISKTCVELPPEKKTRRKRKVKP